MYFYRKKTRDAGGLKMTEYKLKITHKKLVELLRTGKCDIEESNVYRGDGNPITFIEVD